jgi:hypothetical protein
MKIIFSWKNLLNIAFSFELGFKKGILLGILNLVYNFKPNIKYKAECFCSLTYPEKFRNICKEISSWSVKPGNN